MCTLKGDIDGTELELTFGDWKTVDAALRFLYTAQYPPIPADEVFSHSVRMFLFADQFGIPWLAHCARYEFQSVTHWRRIIESEKLRKDLYYAAGVVERDCTGEDLI
jgi:hypothetical protein